jgi:hypothetical protein
MGGSLFKAVTASPRPHFWRIPEVFRSMEEISIYCNNPTLGNQPNVEIALFGYHIPKGLSQGEAVADYERYQNVNWQ